jgi:hypothetical protein
MASVLARAEANLVAAAAVLAMPTIRKDR